jgi:hypothetical protein
MSYPRRIHTLIIEDDPRAREHYKEVFLSLNGLFGGLPIAPPQFAVSYEEAKRELVSHRIFQFVILDLCIPEKSNHPAGEGINLGQSILEICLQRDHYPIPGMLIITGNAASTAQSLLRSRLERGFAYSTLIVKDGEFILEEVERAIRHIAAYLDIGIHIRSNDARAAFSLRPREEDLLRRAVLSMDKVGLDLSWQPIESATKRALTGHVLLADGEEAHRTYSFEFGPSADFDLIVGNARALEQRMPSYRVVYSACSGAQMLLVTEDISSALHLINRVEAPGEFGRDGEASVTMSAANPRADSKSIESRARHEPAPRASAYENRRMMSRRAAIVELIEGHADTSKLERLVEELKKCEPEFAKLEVEFVRSVFLGRKNTRPSSARIATELTLQVGAFDVSPPADSEKLNDFKRKLTKLFDEETRRERERRVGTSN